MRPLGIQGYETAEEAIAGARAEVTVNDPVKFAVMHKDGNYAWLLPIDYARRVSEAHGVEIVSAEELRP